MRDKSAFEAILWATALLAQTIIPLVIIDSITRFNIFLQEHDTENSNKYLKHDQVQIKQKSIREIAFTEPSPITKPQQKTAGPSQRHQPSRFPHQSNKSAFFQQEHDMENSNQSFSTIQFQKRSQSMIKTDLLDRAASSRLSAPLITTLVTNEGITRADITFFFYKSMIWKITKNPLTCQKFAKIDRESAETTLEKSCRLLLLRSSSCSMHFPNYSTHSASSSSSSASSTPSPSPAEPVTKATRVFLIRLE